MLQIHQFPCLSDNYGFLIHDPATGATPACSSEGHICVLLCTSSEQCPEGAQCPDPASLPEGAQGFCYRDET